MFRYFYSTGWPSPERLLGNFDDSGKKMMKLLSIYRAFSRCVTSAVWVCEKQDELNLALMQKRSFDPITLRSCWSREWKHCTSSMVRNPSPGDSYIKVTRMLVVSLWGVNCRVWSHLGCLGWKVTLFVRSGACMLSTVHKKKYKKCPDTDHTEISLRGQLKVQTHPHWCPLGV